MRAEARLRRPNVLGSRSRTLGSALHLAVLVLAACGPTRATREESHEPAPAREPASGPREAPPDSIIQYLLTSAAIDFHDHRPPDPARFRDVRVGHFGKADSVVRYLLCGQFQPADGEAEWMDFATIKTSRYEQWLGSQAAGFCQDASVQWEDAGDLSATLQSRVDSLR